MFKLKDLRTVKMPRRISGNFSNPAIFQFTAILLHCYRLWWTGSGAVLWFVCWPEVRRKL